MTRSPTATNCSLPAPSASTTPMPSWPSDMVPGTPSQSPRARWRSEWHTPAALILTSASPLPGSGVGTSPIRSVPSSSRAASMTSRASEPEALVSRVADGGAAVAVHDLAPRVGHHDPRFARDVGAHIPGVRAPEQRLLCDLGDVFDP